MSIEFSAAYAYPTSPNAEELGHYRTGCWYVQRSEDHQPPTIDMGPCDTREEAERMAEMAQAEEWASSPRTSP